MKNRHGLSRNIPADIKRIVRQRCGFGCVICGNAIYEYEHFNPEFKDCKEHLPEGITLLCLRHHGKKTRTFQSLDTIMKANAKPYVKQHANFWENFDIGDKYPKILIGNNEIYNCQNIILIEGRSLLRIDPPEEKEAPFLLSGIFFDEAEKEVLKIKRNEWCGNPESWDVETTAGSIIIKSKGNRAHHTILDISVKHMPKQLVVSKLNMSYKGHRFLISDGVFTYIAPSGGRFTLNGCTTSSQILQKSFVIKSSANKFEYLGSDN